MGCCVTDNIHSDKFCAVINLDVVLVAIEVHLVLLRPAGITIFLSQLVRFLFPGFRGFSFLGLLVLVPAIVLLGHFNKRGIDYLTVFCEDTLVIKSLIESVEESLDGFFLDKDFAELPDGFAVRYTVA